LRDSFEAARARFLAGLAALQQDRLEDAEASFQASLSLLPGRVSTLVNLAATQLRLGRAEAALATAATVLASEPDNRDALYHQACALGQLTRWPAAQAAFEHLLALDQAIAPAWLGLAQALQPQPHRAAAALQACDRALALAPGLHEAWTLRGDLLRGSGLGAQAVDAYRQALAQGGDAALHEWLLAALGAGRVPDGAPPAYVQRLFDQYAADFEAHLLGALAYRGHETLVRLLLAQAQPSTGFASALDLGCGSGLCGPLLRPHAARLEGVDLSSDMLAQAGARGCYDQLVHGELLSHLQCRAAQLDLVLAADVFIYVGALDAVFAAVRRVTGAGALFAFSVERGVADGPELQLRPSLRYAHSEPGLRRLAAAHGFEVLALQPGALRREQGQDIEGLYAVLRRT
jgi:predicted TPR repeat methyltransferase